MKIVVLNPPMDNGVIYMKELGRCGRKSVAGEVWPQTGLAYIAAVLREAGHEILFMDAMASRLSTSETLSRIKTFQPRLAIIHTTTPTFKNDVALLKEIKTQTGAICGLVGTHPTALPEETLLQTESDFVIISEAEMTIRDLVEKIDQDWSEVLGLAYKKNGMVKLNPARPLYPDIDSFPFPARDLMPVESYTMPFFGSEPFVTVIPSRGCPFQCVFCRAGQVWGETTRHRSPDNVCDELEEIINKFGIRNIVMMTDTLTLKVSWTEALCQRIMDRGIKIRWIGNSRVDTVSPKLLKLMKQSGCEILSYGLESGNQEILDSSKKNINLDQTIQAIKWTREAGIMTFGYFIVGLPGETWDTIHDSINFAIKANPDYVNFHVATPFPGTELYSIAKSKGWLITDDWTQYEEEGSAVMRTEHLTPEDLVKAQKMAMRRFYLRPSKILREMVLIIKTPQMLTSKVKAALKVLSDI